MKHTIEDERTRGLKRQVRGEAYLLTAALLLVSLFWKTYGLGLPVTACLTELVVLLVGVVYLAVRSTLVSYEFVDPSKAGRRLRALAVVAISAVVAVANAVRNWNTYGDRYTGLLDGHFLAVPVVTFLAQTMAEIVASSIVIEQVFAIPGIGVLLLSSINNRDFPVVQALVMILVLWVVLVNFLADLLYQYMDPRIRLR